MYDGVSNSYLVIRFCEQNNNTTKKWVALYDNEEDYFYIDVCAYKRESETKYCW